MHSHHVGATFTPLNEPPAHRALLPLLGLGDFQHGSILGKCTWPEMLCTFTFVAGFGATLLAVGHAVVDIVRFDEGRAGGLVAIGLVPGGELELFGLKLEHRFLGKMAKRTGHLEMESTAFGWVVILIAHGKVEDGVEAAHAHLVAAGHRDYALERVVLEAYAAVA